MRKMPFKLNNDLKHVPGTSAQRKQLFADGMLVLNAVEQPPKARSAQVARLR